ncbi:MAG: tRNA (guanosine(46)-N7)-methyltransferase TrmB [Cyanobacteria bacterium]|nr:tRNA (guanosine(46)-N7)-methyltransferase TrmB [Cyanobacteriota bacterium]
MVRQHVNPLSRFFQVERPLPPPAELFADPEQPLHLDIGCARGRFLLALAQQHPERNHLGVEIRLPLVDAAEAERQRLGLTNLHYLFCNANISLETWLAALPAGLLERATIQFPDPWFKLKHHKRRVLQPALLCSLAAALAPGRQLFLQSDVLAVIEPMVALVEASGCFARPEADARPWRLDSPLPVATERESLVMRQGLPVYRVLYGRNEAPVPDPKALEAGAGCTDNPATPPAPKPAATPGSP